MRKILDSSILRSMLVGICIAGSSLLEAQELPIHSGLRVELQSEILHEPREIWIHTPAEYDLSEKPYPVLFLLDARWHFDHVVGTAEFLRNVQQIPPMIVVGIVSFNRSRDMLPTKLSSEAARFGPNVGGADEFLQFIDTEVSSYIRENHRASSYRMLAGHSLGGLTVLRALETKPRRFDLYLALSPSLAYLGDEHLSDWVERVASKSRASQTLSIRTGSEERQLTAAVNEKLVAPLRAKQLNGLSMETGTVPGNHSSMVHSAIADALSRHFTDWTISAALSAHQRGGYPGLREHLLGVRKRYPFDTDEILNEKMFRVAEHAFVSEGVDPAMDLLNRFISDFPNQASPRIREAMARGYNLKGQQERAAAGMKEVYQVNPGSELAVAVLSQTDAGADFLLPPDPLPPDKLEPYVGSYAAEGRPILRVLIRDGELWVRHRGPIPDRLRWLGEQDFFALGTERIHYQFQTNADGDVVGVTRSSALGVVDAARE